MFLPPDQRHPRLPPWEPPPPRRRLSPREEKVVLWLIGLILLAFFLAPIGGSTIVDAVGYLLGRGHQPG